MLDLGVKLPEKNRCSLAFQAHINWVPLSPLFKGLLARQAGLGSQQPARSPPSPGFGTTRWAPLARWDPSIPWLQHSLEAWRFGGELGQLKKVKVGDRAKGIRELKGVGVYIYIYLYIYIYKIHFRLVNIPKYPEDWYKDQLPVGWLLFSVSGLILYTLPKFNSSPLKSYFPNRKVVFQPPFFRDYVKLQGCKWIFFLIS